MNKQNNDETDNKFDSAQCVNPNEVRFDTTTKFDQQL